MQSYKKVQESSGSPRTNKVGCFVIQSGGDIGAPISTDRLPCGALDSLGGPGPADAILSLAARDLFPLSPFESA
jgi:hypothetical protein